MNPLCCAITSLSRFIYIPFLTHLSNLFKYYGNFAICLDTISAVLSYSKYSLEIVRDGKNNRYFWDVSQRDALSDYKAIIYHRNIFCDWIYFLFTRSIQKYFYCFLNSWIDKFFFSIKIPRDDLWIAIELSIAYQRVSFVKKWERKYCIECCDSSCHPKIVLLFFWHLYENLCHGISKPCGWYWFSFRKRHGDLSREEFLSSVIYKD